MNIEKYKQLLNELDPYSAVLVAVSKTKPTQDILTLYQQGQRIFGENKVQEMAAKYDALPKDIEWHLIGHLQSNKVKYIAPFVSMIHSADSLKLLQEIDKQAGKNNRMIDCLLQVYIASEETKYGLSEQELEQLISSEQFQLLRHVRICGLMGMATNTDDEKKIEQEFASLHLLFKKVKAKYFFQSDFFTQLSMGMSADYAIALRHGATLIRIGSVLFGSR